MNDWSSRVGSCVRRQGTDFFDLGIELTKRNSCQGVVNSWAAVTHKNISNMHKGDDAFAHSMGNYIKSCGVPKYAR